jgi:hypothetical protein
VATVVPVDGAMVARVLAAMPPYARHGLGPAAFGTFDAAQARTTWGGRHRRRFALVSSSGAVLASAERYELAGRVDGEPLMICGIAAVTAAGADETDGAPVLALVEHLVDEASRSGVDVALLFGTTHPAALTAAGFAALPTAAVEVTVTESARHGAPMVLVRGGEDRDLDAIAAMGRVRASGYRFHLDRDVDLIAYAITRTRLLAGLSPAGVRRLTFVIAEEGITAAAYLVVSIAGGVWTIEECGDRDASGARVGALLQALIAREPAESRPVIHGWFPPEFRPPQLAVTAVPPAPAHPALLARPLSTRVRGWLRSIADTLYWLDDVYA